MQEVLLKKKKIFERELSKTLKKLNLFFLLNTVPFNRQNYHLESVERKGNKNVDISRMKRAFSIK